jgi:hypothetical protein
MAMITAYLDEAGTDNKKPAVAVGCYLASQEGWYRFNPLWAKLKEQEHIGYFHRTDQESCKAQFEGWTIDRKIRVYQEQHKIIHTHAQHGLGCAVIKTDYEEVIVGKDRELLGNAYEFCLRHCLSAITNFANRIGYNDDIAYVFEAGAEGENHFNAFMKSAYDAPVLRGQHRIGSWTFADKRKLLPLQAADALAYELAKEMENAIDKYSSGLATAGRGRDVRKSALDLLRSTDEIQYWNRVRLERLRSEVEQERMPYLKR